MHNKPGGGAFKNELGWESLHRPAPHQAEAVAVHDQIHPGGFGVVNVAGVAPQHARALLEVGLTSSSVHYILYYPVESYRLNSHTDRIIQDNGQDDVTLPRGVQRVAAHQQRGAVARPPPESRGRWERIIKTKKSFLRCTRVVQFKTPSCAL